MSILTLSDKIISKCFAICALDQAANKAMLKGDDGKKLQYRELRDKEIEALKLLIKSDFLKQTILGDEGDQWQDL